MRLYYDSIFTQIYNNIIILKYLITIIILFSAYQANSKTRDINVYGTFNGYILSVEFDLEYSILNTDVFGMETTTYLKYGTSLIGIQGLAISYSQPIIGFTQYFGIIDGIEIGGNYFKWHVVGAWGNRKKPHPITKEEFLSVEVGYRKHFSNNGIFRLVFTPIYSLDNPRSNFTNFKNFQFMLRVSFGYSF